MTRLTELRARVDGPYRDGSRELYMRCPNCGEHGVTLRLWDKPAKPATLDKAPIYRATGMLSIDTLTLEPEVDVANSVPGCGGWRGQIKTGRVIS